jgi:hypothetical protein
MNVGMALTVTYSVAHEAPTLSHTIMEDVPGSVAFIESVLPLTLAVTAYEFELL